jgi:hypothetical protein
MRPSCTYGLVTPTHVVINNIALLFVLADQSRPVLVVPDCATRPAPAFHARLPMHRRSPIGV